IGIGAAAILEWVTEQTQNIKGGAAKAFPVLVTGMLVLLGPVKMMAENYHTHDRTGNYVASDYSYNMLVNCETNGIMFTNGDNDTFPLWYLQEVDQVRTDVRVANLSLLNTPWYIEQLKHKEPKVPISYSDEQIENIELKIWPKERKFEIPIRYEKVRNLETQRYNSLNLSSDSVVADQKLSFKIKPKYQVPTRGGGRVGALRVQDLMILNILSTNQFRKPVYFAVTTSRQNQLDELQKYLRMDGLVFKVTTIPGWEIDPEILYDNLMNKFRYRNLNNPDVYFNDNIIGLVQNYRSAFFRLAHHYLLNDERERFDEVIQKLSEKMPPEVIPFTNRQFEQVLTGFGILAGVYPLDTLNTQNFSLPELQSYGQMAESYGGAELIKAAYGEVLKQIEANPGSP
ncbi:MAG: hypothetical protein GWN16_13585, partial [Calditrichae bacterium]|nr:hypothetical protein [Calditrichia bacterium]